MNGAEEINHFSILYVDDEEMALKYFSQAFSKSFNIITSNCADSAREILDTQTNEIAVLLTDQRMPNETGTKLLQYARENYPDIVRLLTTAYSDIKDAIDAVNHGEIYRYITKPWNVRELHDQLNSAILLHLTRRHEQDLLKEKRRAMFQLAGNIAHELRTPLLSIKSAASGTENFLPRLLDIYQQARKLDPSIPEIRTPHLQKMETILDDITKETQHSLTIIDMLMANAANEHNTPDSFCIYSMRDCINEALQRYPFKKDQDKLITFESNFDFLSYGSPILMTHVFFNLLKNSLYAISANGNKGNIDISLSTDAEFNQIFFKDNSTGIEASVLPYIFEDFYSTKSTGLGHNIGLGLPFCRHTLEAFNGNIQCRSKYGEYTEFILSLPIVSENGKAI